MSITTPKLTANSLSKVFIDFAPDSSTLYKIGRTGAHRSKELAAISKCASVFTGFFYL